jgi:hypothetical protein
VVDYLIREAEFGDIGKLCGTLRYDDLMEITCFGVRPFVVIRKCFKQSHYRKTALVEGRLAAMWGLGGVMLGGKGEPWLLTAPAIERAPLAFVREARVEVARLCDMSRHLEGYCAASYVKAHRLLRILGFNLDEPIEHKGAMIRRYWM